MWRAMPLAKMVLRMTLFGVILGAALGLLTVFLFESTIPAPKSLYHRQLILNGIMEGALLAGLAGVAMAFYAAVAHRAIHKPSHFRFAMLIIATIVSLAVVQQPFHIVTLSEFGLSLSEWTHALTRGPVLPALLLGTIAKHIAIGMMSAYVAGNYIRETSERFMKATGQGADQDK